ncbi:hypothetical protein A9976_28930 [Delftia sp. UME58]|nr:hypothetical protein [Delftia sp. UME58]
MQLPAIVHGIGLQYIPIDCQEEFGRTTAPLLQFSQFPFNLPCFSFRFWLVFHFIWKTTQQDIAVISLRRKGFIFNLNFNTSNTRRVELEVVFFVIVLGYSNLLKGGDFDIAKLLGVILICFQLWLERFQNILFLEAIVFVAIVLGQCMCKHAV